MKGLLFLIFAVGIIVPISSAQEIPAYKPQAYFLLSLNKKNKKSNARLYRFKDRGILHITDVLLAMRKGIMKPDNSPEWGSAKLPGKKRKNGLDMAKPIAAKSGDTFCFAVNTKPLKSIFLNGFITPQTPNFRTTDLKREYIVLTLPKKVDHYYFDERGIASIQVYGYDKLEKKIFGTLIISKVSKERYQQFVKNK